MVGSVAASTHTEAPHSTSVSSDPPSAVWHEYTSSKRYEFGAAVNAENEGVTGTDIVVDCRYLEEDNAKGEG